jgi:hypothetical protein
VSSEGNEEGGKGGKRETHFCKGILMWVGTAMVRLVRNKDEQQ